MSNPHVPISRRGFCSGVCQAASGATLATFFAGCGGSPTSPSGMPAMLGVLTGQFSGSSVQVAVAGSALTGANGAVLVESTAGRFLVARTGASSFAAVEAVCTHAGCTVNGIDGDVYVCPCHGSRYTRSGRVVGGPATASLRQYSASFADGVVTIAL